MPTAPRPNCTVVPDCSGKATHGKACADHHKQARQQERRYSRGVAGIGYNLRAWIRQAAAYRIDHPWCVLCPPEAKRLSTEVDHIMPHRGDADLFWDQRNWQAVCRSCHSKKTAREVGLGGQH